MKVILADKAGACYGVNRSIDLVKKASTNSKNIATLGELIHNPKVVTQLEKKGIYVINSLEDAAQKNIDTVVIRSHGVEVNTLNKAHNLKLNVVDATCPHVAHVQKTAYNMAKKYGAVLVIGKDGHPEVKSVCSYIKDADAKYFVAQSFDDVNQILPLIRNYDVVGVVSQTTQSLHNFNKIINYLINNNLNLDIQNTICSATVQRQNACEELSKEVDAFVIIGGKNSSNTTHLYQICKNNCKKTYHIEDISELERLDFLLCKKIGVSAGASTPPSQIDPVITFLQKLA